MRRVTCLSGVAIFHPSIVVIRESRRGESTPKELQKALRVSIDQSSLVTSVGQEHELVNAQVSSCFVQDSLDFQPCALRGALGESDLKRDRATRH